MQTPAPAYRFALIISGEHAPTPAPRCAAVPSVTTAGGVHVPAIGDWLRPCYDGFRAALPPRLRRYCPAMPSLWYRKGVAFDGDRTGPALPYIHLRNARGDLVATVYVAICAPE